MSMQTMILLGAAALVLIVVSAVVTGMLLAGKFDSKHPAPVVAEVRPPAPVATPLPAIPLNVPKPAPPPVVVATPVPTQPPAPPAAVEPTPAPVFAAAPKPAPATAPAAGTAPSGPSAAATAAAAQAQNDNIQNMIDKYRVSGVRASGADSKALIDGHVYKVGDYLDRALGLKLIGVDQDHLTFTIKDGSTFTKGL